MNDRWFFLPINPEQWAIGPVSVGRKGGKIYPIVGQNSQLHAYQEAIGEELNDVEQMPEGKYSLTFYVWRVQAEYEGKTRKIKKHEVDATNIQKATEDALQGVLFGNDRDVRDVRTVVVEQGSSDVVVPGIVIRCSVWDGFDPQEIPEYIWSKIDANAVELSFEDVVDNAHSYHEDEQDF